MTPDTYHGRTIAEWHAYAAALSVELEQCKAELRHANKEIERLWTAIHDARDHDERELLRRYEAAKDAEVAKLKGATT